VDLDHVVETAAVETVAVETLEEDNK
jgi:hypothetical protein